MVSRRTLVSLAGLGLLAMGATTPFQPAVAAPTPVDTVAVLEQSYWLADDGTAVMTVTIVPGVRGPAELALPFGEAGASDFSVESGGVRLAVDSTGAAAPVRGSAGRALLVLDLPAGVGTEDTLRVRCRVPHAIDWAKSKQAFGACDVSRTFVNDAGVSIGTYRLELWLPESYRYRRVTGSEPAFKPQVSPDPPYAIGHRNARDVASLTVNHFRPGARARLGLEAERVGRGPVPLIGGLILGILYLVFFRNTVAGARQRGARPIRQENQS